MPPCRVPLQLANMPFFDDTVPDWLLWIISDRSFSSKGQSKSAISLPLVGKNIISSSNIFAGTVPGYVEPFSQLNYEFMLYISFPWLKASVHKSMEASGLVSQLHFADQHLIPIILSLMLWIRWTHEFIQRPCINVVHATRTRAISWWNNTMHAVADVQRDSC